MRSILWTALPREAGDLNSLSECAVPFRSEARTAQFVANKVANTWTIRVLVVRTRRSECQKEATALDGSLRILAMKETISNNLAGVSMPFKRDEKVFIAVGLSVACVHEGKHADLVERRKGGRQPIKVRHCGPRLCVEIERSNSDVDFNSNQLHIQFTWFVHLFMENLNKPVTVKCASANERIDFVPSFFWKHDDRHVFGLF